MELYNPLGGQHDLSDTHSTEETEAQRGYGVCLNYTASSTAEPERTAVSFLPPMCAPQVVESKQGLRQHAQLTAPVRMEKLSLLEREGFRQREKLGGQG